MTAEEAASLLAGTRLFGDVDADTLKLLGQRSTTRSFQPGQLVFREGDPGDALFVVAEGVVRLLGSSEDGDETAFATLAAPQVFGELALVDGRPRAATAQAVEPTTLLVLRRAELREVLRTAAGLVEALLRLLGDRLRRTDEYAADLVLLDLPGRVAGLLLDLAEQRGEPDGDHLALDLDLAQSELAEAVGGSPPSVNRILRSFESRGFVEIAGGTIRIVRADLLRRRAQP